LQIKYTVCWIALGEEVLLLLQFDDSSAKPRVREKDAKIRTAVLEPKGMT